MMVFSSTFFLTYITILVTIFIIYFIIFYIDLTDTEYGTSFMPLLFTSLHTIIIYHDKNMIYSKKFNILLKIIMYLFLLMFSITTILIFHYLIS